MLTWTVCPGEEPIAAYATGWLGRSEREAIDAHLDTCSACSELVAVLAKLATHAPSRTSDRSLPRPAPRQAPDLDRLLDGHVGRYILLSRIGEGGMGVVYAAYDPELDRRVALKLLRRDSANNALRSEARAIARLAHPNVVAVHDVGRADGASFVAMEFVDGVTLRDWLAEARTPDQVLEAFIQAGRGIAAAHAAGLVHRDIKPSNIMIGRDGRPRVLDFGLASGTPEAIGGTPGYMAPEQARGEAVDPRSDQYALCVSLWEALAGDRPTAALTTSGMLHYVPERVVRALRRGLAQDREARFPSMDALLADLGPGPSRRHLPWLVGAALLIVGAVVATVVGGSSDAAAPCSLAGAPVAVLWSESQRATVRGGFTAIPFAARAGATAIAQLDDWAARWRAGAEASCRATSVDRSQPLEVHALRQACLARLLVQLQPVVALASHPDQAIVASAEALISILPAPERCGEVTLLSAIAPPPERSRAAIAQIIAQAAELETALIVGRTATVREAIHALHARATAFAYPPLEARTQFLEARLSNASTQFSLAIPQLHAAARLAAAARDTELLVEIWIELVRSLGNDVRTTDEANVFDGYVTALIPQLPDRASLKLSLEQARCTRNVTAHDVEATASHCRVALALADTANKPTLAIAARTRLGHFQRMLGHTAEAVATLELAVQQAERVFGPGHPEAAIAHYALGIALTDEPKTSDRAIAELRQALAIRRAAFPEGGLAVAESLQGLGDALASADRHAEAVPLLEEGLAMLGRAGAGTSVTAVNLHILAGMSLTELARPGDALAHDLAAADIAERVLEHREELAAMALRLAAGIEAGRGQPGVGLGDAERALHLLERGNGSAASIGKTQLVIATLAAAARDRPRARAMAMLARTTLLAAGPAGAEDLAAATQLLDSH